MISRRFFMKALAAMSVAPAVSVAAPEKSLVGLTALPRGCLFVYSAGGTLLATMDLICVQTLTGWRVTGHANIEAAGTAHEVRWRVPGGKWVRGTIGPESWDDVRVSTPCLTVGGMLSLEGHVDLSSS